MESLYSLNNFFTKKTLILCLGNELRGDDAFGLRLSDRISDKVPIKVIKAATVPENYVDKILKEAPENVLIVDIAEFKGRPGEIKVINSEQLGNSYFSTHNASIKLTIDYLLSGGVNEIKCLFIQPGSVSFGEKLSMELKKTLDSLTHYLLEKLNS